MTDKGIAGHFWRKSTYILLQITITYCKVTAWFYALFFKKKRGGVVKRIAAIWYWPEDFNSDELRLAYWEKYLKDDGVELVNFSVLDVKEFVSCFEKGIWPEKYLFYRRIILRRWRQFYDLKNFDVVWIDRSFMPFYPNFKTAFFEKLLKKMGVYVVVDSTDGTDYQANPDLVMDTLATADHITVAFKNLEEFYREHFDNVYRVNWTVPVDKYIIKKDWSISDRKPILGWMGSPHNFRFLEDILPELAKVAMEIPFKLIVICRIEKEINLEGIEFEHHFYGDDYHDLIGQFDIGLAPFLEKNFGTEGKIGMKHQEFLICKIPQVCSSVAISEHVRHDEHVLIAENLADWRGNILKLLKSKELRASLGTSGREVFDAHYHYDSAYPILKEALTNFKNITS